MDDSNGSALAACYLDQQARSVLMTQRETWLAALTAITFLAPIGTLLGPIGLLMMRGSSSEVQSLDVASLRRRFRAAKWLTICTGVLSAVIAAIQWVTVLHFVATLQGLSVRQY
jgi:hypothetical protein